MNWVMHPEVTGGNPLTISTNEEEGREEFTKQPLGPIWSQEPHLVQIGATNESELLDYEQGLINSISFSEEHPLSPHDILSPSPRLQPVSAAEELASDFDPEQNEPAFSELEEDDWDVGLHRKEHSSEFQDEAGYDSGDEHSQKKDDDEGDTWSLSD
jgi:hypothetical protein